MTSLRRHIVEYALATIGLMVLAVVLMGQGAGFNAAFTFIASAVSASSGYQQASKIIYHQIAWTITGAPAACTVAVDSSIDGVSWTAGGIIAGQTCTSTGSSAVTNANAAFIRVNVTALSGGSSPILTVNYTGWSYNPSGGAIFTGGAITSPITAANGTAAAPSYSFTAFPTIGLYVNSNLGPVLANNTDILGVNSSGSMLLGLNTTGYRWANSGSSPFAGGGTDTGLYRPSAGVVAVGTTAANSSGSIKVAGYLTDTNCQLGGATGTASPAACSSAAAGAVAIPASQTTYVVNTTAVTANSHIIVQQITDNSGISTATCGTGVTAPLQSTRTAATSFTISLTSVASVTCIQYWIVD